VLGKFKKVVGVCVWRLFLPGFLLGCINLFENQDCQRNKQDYKWGYDNFSHGIWLSN
jgi:hypothetical protein